MIDVKQASQAAADFITELYSTQTISDIRLEEIEISEDGKHWLITLSFPTPRTSALLPVKRDYKIIKVDRESGEVLSMKIRELAHEAA